MKILYCPTCGDARALHKDYPVRCDCGRVYGRYDADGKYATVSRHAQVIGIANGDLREATMYTRRGTEPRDAGYRTLRAWVIAPGARVRWEGDEDATQD